MTAGAARLALNPTRPRSHGTKKHDQTTHLELLVLEADLSPDQATAALSGFQAFRTDVP